MVRGAASSFLDAPLAELVAEVAPSSFVRPSEQLVQLPNHTGALWSRGLRLPPYALNTSAPVMYLNRYAPTSSAARAPVLPSLFMPGFPKVCTRIALPPHPRVLRSQHTPCRAAERHVVALQLYDGGLRS